MSVTISKPVASSKALLCLCVPNKQLLLWYNQVMYGNGDYLTLLNSSIDGSIVQIPLSAERLKNSFRIKATKTKKRYSELSTSLKGKYSNRIAQFDVYRDEIINTAELLQQVNALSDEIEDLRYNIHVHVYYVIYYVYAYMK